MPSNPQVYAQPGLTAWFVLVIGSTDYHPMRLTKPLYLLIATSAILAPAPVKASNPPISIPADAEIVAQIGNGPTMSWIVKFPDQTTQAIITRNRFSTQWSNFRQYARSLQRELKSGNMKLKVTVRRNEYVISGGNTDMAIFAKGRLRRNGRLFTAGAVTGPRGEPGTAALIQAVRRL
jgi:hypothetical protein